MNHKHWSLYIVLESQSKNVFIYKYFGVTIVVQLTTEQRVFCLAQFTPTPNVINRVLENKQWSRAFRAVYEQWDNFCSVSFFGKSCTIYPTLGPGVYDRKKGKNVRFNLLPTAIMVNDLVFYRKVFVISTCVSYAVSVFPVYPNETPTQSGFKLRMAWVSWE